MNPRLLLVSGFFAAIHLYCMSFEDKTKDMNFKLAIWSSAESGERGHHTVARVPNLLFEHSYFRGTELGKRQTVPVNTLSYWKAPYPPLCQ